VYSRPFALFSRFGVMYQEKSGNPVSDYRLHLMPAATTVNGKQSGLNKTKQSKKTMPNADISLPLSLFFIFRAATLFGNC
jgi:hypothetical protein